MKYAPVLIPTVNRYQHFKECLESLSRCTWADKTDVYVAVDYPGKEEQWEGYRKIKEYLELCGDLGFHSLNVTYRETNYYFSGKGNLGTLIKEISPNYDRYIISEDDNFFSPNFLEYMDKCLMMYEKDTDVVAITGYSYPVEWEVSEGATIFKENFCASMWGTGFWRDKYEEARSEICSGKYLYDYDEFIAQRKYSKMLDVSLIEYIPHAVYKSDDRGNLMTRFTDVALRAYLVVENKYVISPVISKVRNYGFDGSGMYCKDISSNRHGNNALDYPYTKQPIDEQESFDIKENELNNLSVNLKKLNIFDRRPFRKVFFPKVIVLLSRILGTKTIKRIFKIIYKISHCGECK